jgi:hypothetical protein
VQSLLHLHQLLSASALVTMCVIFADGFESWNTSRWSMVVD